jgi:hypothetical protein
MSPQNRSFPSNWATIPIAIETIYSASGFSSLFKREWRAAWWNFRGERVCDERLYQKLPAARYAFCSDVVHRCCSSLAAFADNAIKSEEVAHIAIACAIFHHH